ncbi:MAG: hypothetical protein IJ196_05560 [Prevotella sp.]|nr:hypothetical protein [Prevotella sp.]
MKKTILTTLLLMTALLGRADEYQYLAFQATDGTVQQIAVEGLKITFSDGKLTAVAGDDSKTFTLSELSKMYFTNTVGINEVEADGQQDAVVAIYNLQGVKMDAVPDQLPKGIYIIKQNGTTKKITVK